MQTTQLKLKLINPLQLQCSERLHRCLCRDGFDWHLQTRKRKRQVLALGAVDGGENP